MTRPRTTLVALAAVLAGAAASGLGEAQADSTGSSGTTGTATPDTIVVNGTDSIALTPVATPAAEQSTYQTALGDAITNAQSKATFIAGQIGATLGAITNVTETSDASSLCQGPVFLPATAKPTTTTGGKPRHKKAHVIRAHRADVIDTTCTIEADVTVTYAMTPA
jgi:uncharacterized protein YggE